MLGNEEKMIKYFKEEIRDEKYYEDLMKKDIVTSLFDMLYIISETLTEEENNMNEQNYSIESVLCACFLNYLYEEGFCDLCKSECYANGEQCNNNQFIVFADIPHIGKISILCDKMYWDNFKIPACARSEINKNELNLFNSYNLIRKFCESRFSYVSMMKIHDLDK